MPRSFSFTLAAALCLAFAVSAQAQIPNPLRRAKEKATRVLGGQQPAQSQGALTFDNTLLELTPRVVDRVIAGLKVRANYKDASGRTSAELRRRADELNKEAEKLNMDRGNARFEYNNKKGEAENCVGEVLRGVEQQHSQEMMRRFTSMTGANLQGDQSANAKFMQEYTRLSQEMSAAGIAQDTARANKAKAAWNKLMGFDPKADSAKANAQCNVPPPPAWMVRADAASEESNLLYNQARDLEVRSADTAVRVSGLTAEQFAMGAERVTAYVQLTSAGSGSTAIGSAAGTGSSASLWKFTAAEEIAMKARMAELKLLVG